jgi:Ni/Fe-hydrogenase 1 B-type cytochrome subunit
MPTSQIKRLPVWSKPLRISHWALTLATLLLLASGWLIRWAPERADQVRDFHYLGAALLLAALAARLWLLFAGKESERIQGMLPNRHRWRQALEVLRSYLTLGKLPLPRWYAHNPLWGPLYLLLFAVLLAQAGTGLLLLNQVTLLGGISLRSLHAGGYLFVLVFTLLHLAAVFFHDARGSSDDISGMVNGHRLFTIEPLQTEPVTTPRVIPLDALAKQLKAKKKSGPKPS